MRYLTKNASETLPLSGVFIAGGKMTDANAGEIMQRVVVAAITARYS